MSNTIVLLEKVDTDQYDRYSKKYKELDTRIML